MLICIEAPEVVAGWHDNSNNVVIVNVPDEESLISLAAQAVDRGLSSFTFIEPDLDDEVTAVAFAPGLEAGRLCSNLPLALKEATLRS